MVCRKFLLRVFLLVMILAISVPAYATYVAVDQANWTGSRSIGSGLKGEGEWSGAGTLTIAWNIAIEDGTVNADHVGWVRYEYTITSTTRELSHAIFEISTGTDASNFYVPSDFDGIGFFSSANPSNPLMPAQIYGMKLDGEGPFTFWSAQLPMWGDVYFKDGNMPTTVAWNLGFGTDPVGTNFTNWVAVPDTQAVPLPGAVWLLGAGLIGLVGIRRRMQR